MFIIFQTKPLRVIVSYPSTYSQRDVGGFSVYENKGWLPELARSSKTDQIRKPSRISRLPVSGNPNAAHAPVATPSRPFSRTSLHRGVVFYDRGVVRV